jgi:GT2 family glycosyltransferase
MGRSLSVIIITFNSARFIISYLDSLFSQVYQDFDVFIVDNGSRDNTLSLIGDNYPTVKLIENKENLGPCKARNQGIEIAQGSWILTLDCDVILQKDFLFKMMMVAGEIEDNVGMIQPKILRENKEVIYSTGIYLSRLRRFYDIGKGKIDNGQFGRPRYIFGACAAAALYKRQMLEEVKEERGYFDERFFFLVEDVDLSWRAQRKGWRSLYYPEAVCYHLGDSSNTSRKIRQYYCFRNRYYSIIKNEAFKDTSVNFFLLFAYDFLRLFYLIFNNPSVLKALKEISRFIKDEKKLSRT